MELEPFDPLVPALVVFARGTVASHVLFVRLWPRSRQFWWRADYLAIVIAGFALVPVSADVRKGSATRLLEVAEARAEQGLRDMRWAIDLSQSFVYCAPPFQEAEPDAATDYLDVCEWGQRATSVLDEVDDEIDVEAREFVVFDPDEFPEPPALAVEAGKPGWEFDRQLP